MKPEKKIVHQQKQTTNESNNCWSRLNVSRAARNSFVGRLFVTHDVEQGAVYGVHVENIIGMSHSPKPISFPQKSRDL